VIFFLHYRVVTTDDLKRASTGFAYVQEVDDQRVMILPSSRVELRIN
jgi:hypothetical protein